MFVLFAQWLSQMMTFVGFIQSRRFKDPLTKEEEAIMIERLNKGDIEARNALIEHNLRLVAHIVKKYDIHKIDKEDLISIGTIGLIKAIDTYRSDTGHKLTTYAARCIENEILMTLRSNVKHANTRSLNEPIQTDSDGSEMCLIDAVADSRGKDPIDEFMLCENIKKMMKYLDLLDQRELEIITKRYGLFNQPELTQKEIAKEYHISRSYVSRIEKRATIKLYKAFCKHEMKKEER